MSNGNYFKWLYSGWNTGATAMDEFKETDHPRGGPENKGRFTEKPETTAKRERLDPNAGAEAGSENGKKISECSPKEYAETITEAKKNVSPELQWRVDAKSEEEYAHCKKLLKTPKGSCIAVKDNGDIVSLCRADGDRDVRGSDLLRKAMEEGGDRLDTFDGNWGFYVKNGFTPISWTPFNEEYAPEGWVKGRDKPEDVVFFAYTGNRGMIDMKEWKANNKPFTGESGYDDAMAARDNFLKGKNK